MADVKAISLQGINHHLDKINVQDGMCEDLVNLRFKDGSWRTSGDGQLIINADGNAFDASAYEQMFIHTNVYRHLLGVNKTTHKLCWFANLTPKSDQTSTEHQSFDFTALNPVVELCDVQGDIKISQTGHILTIIDTNGKISYFVFKVGIDVYKNTRVDQNGDVNDTGLFPFGEVHFNLYSPSPLDGEMPTNDSERGKHVFYQSVENGVMYSDALKIAYGKAVDSNVFTRPFLAIAAVKLYDGTYVYASNPVLIFPRQKSLRCFGFNGDTVLEYMNMCLSKEIRQSGSSGNHCPSILSGKYTDATKCFNNGSETTMAVGSSSEDWMPSVFSFSVSTGSTEDIIIQGSDLVLSVSEIKREVFEDTNIFDSLCVFVTPEVDIYDYDKLKYERDESVGSNRFAYYLSKSFRSVDDISTELLSSNFYLLKEIKSPELRSGSVVVSLTDFEYDGAIKNIVQGDTLKSYSISRSSLLPNVQYYYNGRLHLANYKSKLFHGYPITFHSWNNHSVVVNSTSSIDEHVKGVALADNEKYVSNKRGKYTLYSGSVSEGNIVALVKYVVEINGVDKVVYRCINGGSGVTPNVIESIDPLICFPDARAKTVSIYIVTSVTTNDDSLVATVSCKKDIELKPHNILNMSFFLSSDLRPLSLNSTTESYPIQVTEGDSFEHYPNGLKVSSTNNPMVFEAKHTYQVGSSEIVAMCANAISVGTGQTGAAPLYVFTKDGIYAMFVDSSGEMAYTNSRIIARDVCNNAKSVTPIDAGVVFTTDRGLMNIAGNEVNEIGQPLEGDYLSIDADKVTKNAWEMIKLASLPTGAKTSADFLTYLKGAIVCYNHNERELMVSNPSYNYTYVLEDEGNWSKRDYSADEYVNNFPTAYRVKGGKFYQVDNESDADNGCFLLTREIKLDSIGFKSVDRFVARGYFDTGHTNLSLGDCALTNTSLMKTYNVYAETECEGTLKASAIETSAGVGVVERARVFVNGVQKGELYSQNKTIDISLNKGENEIKIIRYIPDGNIQTPTSGGLVTLPSTPSFTSYNVKGITVEVEGNLLTYLGLYVYGSYDGRKWAMLGHQEKAGKFTDIGATVAHPDCKFFRVCMAGQLTKDSRFDYFEVSSKQSRLSTKIR